MLPKTASNNIRFKQKDYIIITGFFTQNLFRYKQVNGAVIRFLSLCYGKEFKNIAAYNFLNLFKNQRLLIRPVIKFAGVANSIGVVAPLKT